MIKNIYSKRGKSNC